jgi:thermostable 8-oxoguanine DNA glycosylase
MLAYTGGCDLVLTLPPAHEHALPGVPWGRFDELFTPAYWRGQAWQHETLGTYAPGSLGRDLAEELAACMLGGYGIPAELGLAAFERLRQDGLLVGFPQVTALEAALARPFLVDGRPRRYRFPRVKARSLAGALRGLPDIDCGLPDRELRDALVCLPGVGPKTASWVVRNWRRSDKVAILDVHIARAGRIAGFLPADWDPARHYPAMESAFLRFSEAIGVRPSVLDGIMWDYMR